MQQFADPPAGVGVAPLGTGYIMTAKVLTQTDGAADAIHFVLLLFFHDIRLFIDDLGVPPPPKCAVRLVVQTQVQHFFYRSSVVCVEDILNVDAGDASRL